MAFPLVCYGVYKYRNNTLREEIYLLRTPELKCKNRIKENPRRIIYASEIAKLGTVRFVVYRTELDKTKCEENDMLLVDGVLYLFKDGDFCEVIDDLPNFVQ